MRFWRVNSIDAALVDIDQSKCWNAGWLTVHCVVVKFHLQRKAAVDTTVVVSCKSCDEVVFYLSRLTHR